MIRILTIAALAMLLEMTPVGSEISLGVRAGSDPSILQVTTSDDGRAMVILDGVGALGIAVGDILSARRSGGSPGSILNSGVDSFIETGSIKVTRVEGDVAFGVALKDGTPVSKQVFPKFPGLMAGDLLSRAEVEIVKNLALTPVISMAYDRVFADPTSTSSNYELSEDGKRRLKAEVADLSRLRLSRVMVEGYTDAKGSADLSQIESYQRAMTVRQFLINEAGFDQDRIQALGFGESDPLPGPRGPDSERLNRRIVIKVLPQ